MILLGGFLVIVGIGIGLALEWFRAELHRDEKMAEARARGKAAEATERDLAIREQERKWSRDQERAGMIQQHNELVARFNVLAQELEMDLTKMKDPKTYAPDGTSGIEQITAAITKAQTIENMLRGAPKWD